MWIGGMAEPLSGLWFIDKLNLVVSYHSSYGERR